ncbi:immunoglobulin domain-containing protein [Citrobacter sp. CK195]|uniref:immunoglobulin domain-containing protein n=1 Tax=Citrobacter sp. CK195 TaxID=2985104 RepID=UPI002576FADC|nr:immunoglobulin domain-containing protein [Citrobacter sp. CK195]MDM2993427.1 immunoglobulin domain-containing protein [Citrobacter sp. CK195]
MADCQNSNERLFGGAVVLEVADGCPDAKPQEADWKSLAAGTSKGFDFNPNTVTSDADDGGGYVETIITNSDFTISFEGEVRKKDKLDQYGVGRFIEYFAGELKAKRQPGIWVRMDYGPVEFIGYMNITALSSDGGTNDIVTFSTEFKVGDASTIEVVAADELVFTTDLTATKSVETGSALTMTVAVDGGTAPYTYVWKKDGSVVSGQTAATFNEASAASGDEGVYTCEVTDSSLPAQTVTSTACTVAVS